MFLLLTALVLNACSQTEEKTSNSAVPEENSELGVTDSDTTKSEEVEEVQSVDSDVLFLADQNEQLGGEAFSDSGLNEKSQIVDKDGYTYILTPSIDTRSESGTLYVSILKGDEFIVKEKVIDIEMPSKDSDDRYRYTKTAFYENTLLIVSRDSTKYRSPNQFIFTTVTVNEKGEAETKEVRRSVSDDNNLEDSLISGLKGYYYFEKTDSNHANIVDKDGKLLYSFSMDGTYPVNSDVVFLDEENGRIYFYGSDGNIAFDLNHSEMIWDANGSEMLYDFPAGYRVSRLASNNGMYILRYNSSTQNALYFYEINNGEPALASNGIMESALEAKYEYSDILSIDDKFVNVYKIVIYKGEPTIQKFSFTRVDL
ncbi:hypothetical protein QTL97_14435 [Sporosarcina thermotolerans]|uniref:Lipoprotein n=1 Tax=Sporosarcina thermotolerans TaxID=633404 RepID=A0AAW9AB02_9BACL|nr:hypothetical protein [Sporosarcina thermotolerans]MDW0118130.1 hypothetical protein [Sporosarcina thermotolerans]WHT47623.1 hypothetical protein QNH10_15975 [Sporosarcina thermotolerans]